MYTYVCASPLCKYLCTQHDACKHMQMPKTIRTCARTHIHSFTPFSLPPPLSLTQHYMQMWALNPERSSPDDVIKPGDKIAIGHKYQMRATDNFRYLSVQFATTRGSPNTRFHFFLSLYFTRFLGRSASTKVLMQSKGSSNLCVCVCVCVCVAGGGAHTYDGVQVLSSC